MSAHWDSSQPFRTAPPSSVMVGSAIRDSYTGLLWCGAGLHLLTPENLTPSDRCRPCSNTARRVHRASKR